MDLAAGPGRPWATAVTYLAGVAGGAATAASGVRAVLAPHAVIDLGSTLGVGSTLVNFDGLAGMFLTLTGALAVVISACLFDWARIPGRMPGRGTGAGYMLLLGSVAVILVSGDAFSFLFAWESLTVSFFILAGINRKDHRAGRAAWVTFGVGKFSGAALLIGFMLLAGTTASFNLAAWSHVTPGGLKDVAFALIVAGFAAKVGVVPFQVWMPLAYPAAVGPARAALAGLAANVGFYGLWRFLGILGRPPVWLGVVVLVAGGFTALLGIVFAAVQGRLERVIAYSSVENAGLIVVGYGVALAGASTGLTSMVAVGLLAASLQVLAHAVSKTALFVSSSFFADDWGSSDLDELRGVGYTHHWSGSTFAVASLTLSGLPPTVGFVSEWFLLESLMQEFRLGPLELRLAMGAAGAMVALTTGIAALTFARLIGLTVLGRSSGPVPRTRKLADGGLAGRCGLGLLAVSCVGLAAVAPWIIRFISHGLAPVVAYHVSSSALKSPWVLQPVYKDFSILSPSWLVVVMPAAFVVVALAGWTLSRGRLIRIRRVPAWRSATAGVSGADRYSSFGYANVARHVLGNVLGSRREVVAVVDEDDAGVVEVTRVETRSTVVEPVEAYLYRPGRQILLRASSAAKKLQSGRLDAYIAYMLFALIAVLIVVAAL